MTGLLLRRAVVVGNPTLADIRIENGVIQEIRPSSDDGATSAPGVRVEELGGRVVIPSFAEPHLHLDKAYLGAAAEGAGLSDAIARTAERKALFTAEDVRERAARVLVAAVSNGTTAIRAQTEVDPGIGLLSLHALTALAEHVRGAVRVQLAVFPQEGIFSRPGTYELLRESLGLPDVAIGACPYAERTLDDAIAHVETVLDLAVEFGVPADLHLDLADDTSDPRFALAETVADAVIRRGLQGRVSIGHATTLASLEPEALERTLARLAEAEITVVVLPATDLYLTGRSDRRNVRRGVAPVDALWRSGVPAALSSNNIQNAFTPTGTVDPLDMALLLARVSHLSSPADFDRALEMTTTAAHRVLDPGTPRGVTVGAAADLVVLDTDDPAGVVVSPPVRTLVVSGGEVVFRQTLSRRWEGQGTALPPLERAS